MTTRNRRLQTAQSLPSDFMDHDPDYMGEFRDHDYMGEFRDHDYPYEMAELAKEIDATIEEALRMTYVEIIEDHEGVIFRGNNVTITLPGAKVLNLEYHHQEWFHNIEVIPSSGLPEVKYRRLGNKRKPNSIGQEFIPYERVTTELIMNKGENTGKAVISGLGFTLKTYNTEPQSYTIKTKDKAWNVISKTHRYCTIQVTQGVEHTQRGAWEPEKWMNHEMEWIGKYFGDDRHRTHWDTIHHVTGGRHRKPEEKDDLWKALTDTREAIDSAMTRIYHLQHEAQKHDVENEQRDMLKNADDKLQDVSLILFRFGLAAGHLRHHLIGK